MRRREFLVAGSAAATQLRAQTAHECRIRVFADRPCKAIDRYIYGLFAEHLGRCIYGGMMDEGSSLSDEHGFRKDVIEAFREMNPPMIRWPGGFFATYYRWQDGVGPRDQRPRKMNIPWKQEESNRFGTDEFVAWSRKAGAEPQIVLNTVTGGLEEALGWWEYCNGVTNTHYANMRRKNGHPDPYGIRYWELDNEMWVLHPPTTKGGSDYAERVYPYARMLRRMDPQIRIIACGLGKPEWDRPVLERLGDMIDYLAVHHYVGGKPETYAEVLGSWREIDDLIRTTRDSIDAVTREKQLKRRIGIAFNEYNIVRDWSSGQGPGDNRFELRFNLRDALWLATVLNVFQRHADVLKIANYSELVNVVAPVMTNAKGMFRQTTFHTLKLYSRHCGDMALESEVESDTFSTKSHKSVPYIDVSATRHSKTGRVALIAANLHETRAVEAAINLTGMVPAGEAEVHEINGATLDTENSFEQPSAVILRPKGRTRVGKTFRYQLPAHSVTLLELFPGRV